MAITQRGTVRDGAINLNNPLPIPDGTEVLVTVEPVGRAHPSADGPGQSFTSLPFFGMWADRDDFEDPVTWLRQEREHWHQRAARRD